ncbi:hypothetical protein [Bhargavaea beijingensis]|uniref:hypothetical protein n=1 Tax=Bhargavaea beijingensis TaxID=426756 RepID=UPI002224B24C|nr:hypothetical protein [Bhargavaea beijingensis]MCW1927396.1 hypothetical protein [Bhargavaea beijingensis]
MDIESLRTRIHDEEDQVLFDETITCYKHSALRAAYIMNWINITESLKRKFTLMAAKDSNLKKKVIGKIEKMEEQKRPTDGFLLESARKYNMISEDQKTKLNHLREMRGFYAHPLNKEPSIIEVEFAITLAVDAVLSQPALLKHAFIKDLMKLIYSTQHYIDDNQEKIENKAVRTLKLIDPIVFDYFFKTSITHLERIIEDESKSIFIRRGFVFIEALLEKCLEDEISIDEWRMESLIHDNPQTISWVFSSPHFWSMIDEEVQDAVLGYLTDDTYSYQSKTDRYERFVVLYKKELLSENQSEKFINTIQSNSIITNVSLGVPIELFKDAFIVELQSRNWYRQNDAITAINQVEKKDFETLSKGELVELGRNILQAADGNSKRAIDFIHSRPAIDSWPQGLLEGIFLETFINESKQIRIKRFFKTSLEGVLNFELEDLLAFFSSISRNFESASLKYSFEEKDYQLVLHDMDDLLEDIPDNKKEILQSFKMDLERTVTSLCEYQESP